MECYPEKPNVKQRALVIGMTWAFFVHKGNFDLGRKGNLWN